MGSASSEQVSQIHEHHGVRFLGLNVTASWKMRTCDLPQ